MKTQSDRPWTPPRSFLWKASWRGCGAYGASSSSPPRTASFLFEDASLYINRSLGYYSCEKVRQNYVAVKRQNPNTNNDNKTNTVTTVDLYVKQVVQGATSRPLLEQLSVKDCESSTASSTHGGVREARILREDLAQCGVLPAICQAVCVAEDFMGSCRGF